MLFNKEVTLTQRSGTHSAESYSKDILVEVNKVKKKSEKLTDGRQCFKICNQLNFKCSSSFTVDTGFVCKDPPWGLRFNFLVQIIRINKTC